MTITSKKNHCIMCNDSAIYHIYPIHHIMTSLVPRVTLRPTGFFFARTDRAPTLWRDESFRAGRKDQMWSWKRMNRPTERTGRETEILAESSTDFFTTKISMAVTKKWSCDMIIVYFFGCGSLMKMMVPVTSRDHRHHCWTNPQKFLRFYRET